MLLSSVCSPARVTLPPRTSMPGWGRQRGVWVARLMLPSTRTTARSTLLRFSPVSCRAVNDPLRSSEFHNHVYLL